MSNRRGSATSGPSEQHWASRSSQDLQLCPRWGGDAPGTGHPSGPHRDLLQQVLAMLFVTEGSLACPLAKNEVLIACFNSSVSLMLLLFLKPRHGSDTSNQRPWRRAGDNVAALAVLPLTALLVFLVLCLDAKSLVLGNFHRHRLLWYK